MERRTTTEIVIFRHPFRLSGFDCEEAPGNYTVEVEQEALDSLTLIGWRHISTTIMLRRHGATECILIDPMDLREARDRDQHNDLKDFL